MRKRVISLFLAIILALTSLPVIGFASAPASVVSTETQNNELLSALNIFVQSDIEIYDAGYFINRGYFAVILKRLANSNKTYTDTELKDILKFTDVNPSGEMAEGIAFCVENGYMNGTGEYEFEPEARITLEQALKPLVIMLGRKGIAEEKGGYPMGYIKAADSIDLTDGISESMGEALNRNVGGQLIYNALMSEYMELYMIENSDEGVYVHEKGADVTYMREVFGIELISGVVEGNEVTMLDVNGKTADEGSIIIDGITVKGENLNGFLGYFVDCYARVNERNNTYENVYTAVNEKENKILTVKAEDIDSFKDGALTYYDENGRKKEVKLAKNADVIFNGVAMPDYTDEHFMPNSGYVTLVNNKSSWNVALITYYNTAVVGYVDTKNEKVHLLDSAGSIEYGDSENNISIDLDGIGISAFELKEWDVLSIAADKVADISTGKLDISNSRVFNIRVRRGSFFTSPLTGISDDVVVFDGPTLEFSENLQRNMPDLNMGDLYDGAVDVDGKLAYLKKAQGSGSYAILGKFAVEGSWEKKTMFRIFTSGGAWVNHDAADKVKIDGQMIKNNDIKEILSKAPYISEVTGAFEPCLVKYSLDSDLRITAIDTPVMGPDENEKSMSQPQLQTGTYDGGAYWIAWFQNGPFLRQQGTTFFNVPTIKGVIDASIEEMFSIGSKLRVNNNYCTTATLAADGFNGYKQAVYTFNTDEYKTTDVVVYTREYVSGTMNKSELEGVVVVDEVMESLKDDGSVATVLKGYNARMEGDAVRDFVGYIPDDVTVEDNCIIGKLENMTIKDLKKGDVLRVATREVADGIEIGAIFREFSPSNEESVNPDLYGGMCISSKNGNNWNDRGNTVSSALHLGWPYSVNDMFITLTNKKDAENINPAEVNDLYGFWQDKTIKPYVLFYNRDRDTLTATEDFMSIPTWKSVGDIDNVPVCLYYSTINYLKMVLVIE